MTAPELARNDEVVLAVDEYVAIVPAEPPVLTTGLARALVKLALHLDGVRSCRLAMDTDAGDVCEQYRPLNEIPRVV